MKQERNITFLSSTLNISVAEHLHLLCQMMEAAKPDMHSSEQVTAA